MAATEVLPHRIPLYGFGVPPRSKWSKEPEDGASASKGSWRLKPFVVKKETAHIDKLRLVTFNVWFQWEQFGRDRADELLRVIKESDADIVCLQEVTPNFIEVYTNDPYIRENFFVSDIDGSTINIYGVVVLTRLKTHQHAELIHLPSSMSRELLVIQFGVNNEMLAIGTVHLESLAESSQTRRKQLEVISKSLLPFQHSILSGDFNFDSDSENGALSELLPEHIDTWPYLRPTLATEGKTYDPTKNGFLLRSSPNVQPIRIDRVLVKSQPSVTSPTDLRRWVPTSIELLGSEPFLRQNEHAVHISDHFGLLVTLEWTGTTGEGTAAVTQQSPQQ